MSRTIAVIGAGYGDEGKGRTVDDLLEGAGNALVIRHNSSAQAGHTVQVGRQRHIHSHFGSGSLREVATMLAGRFVVSPEAWLRERADLRALGVNPAIVCEDGCLVTTPYDRAANQVRELARGENRHGSCGAGFGETIGRHEVSPGLSITVGMLESLRTRDLELRLLAIRSFYARLLREEIEAAGGKVAAFLKDGAPDLSRWIETARWFSAKAEIISGWNAPKDLTIVFEGAQGLMLDAEHEFFPHVTRCKTGLADIAPIALQIGRPTIDVYYVTRCYATRHGAGPLPYEVDDPPVPGFSDATNAFNAWQGDLRFAPLDLDRLGDAIRLDIADGRRRGLEVNPHLVVTCVDQLDDAGNVSVVFKGRPQLWGIDFMSSRLAGLIGSVRSLTFTYGPQRGARHVSWERSAA